MSAARTPSPASSTLRWNRIPAKPPRMAPTRLARATTTRAMMLAVLRVPASTGIRGKLFSCPRTSYLLPPTAPATATATAISTAHSQTATPFSAPLNSTIRAAVSPAQQDDPTQRCAVEPRHRPGDVPAAEVRHEQVDQQHNGPHHTNGFRVLGGLGSGLANVGLVRDGNRSARSRDDGRQQDRDPCGGQPAVQRGTHLDAAVLRLLGGQGAVPIGPRIGMRSVGRGPVATEPLPLPVSTLHGVRTVARAHDLSPSARARASVTFRASALGVRRQLTIICPLVPEISTEMSSKSSTRLRRDR